MKMYTFMRAALSLLEKCSQAKGLQRHICVTSTVSYTQCLGGQQLRRLCSWQTHLELEKKCWQKTSLGYKDLATAFKERLDKLYQETPLRSEREMITHGNYVYFEEDSCIYRFHKAHGEESLELLFSPEDVGLQESVVQRIRVSPCQTFLAINLKGFDTETSNCYIVKVKSTPELACTVQNVFSFEWVNDNIMFHTRLDNLQCHSVWLTDLSDGNATKLVYKEQDLRFFVDLYLTRDHRFLTINSNSKTTSEVWLIDCYRPFHPLVLLQRRVPGVMYHVEHSNGYLYILTTYKEPSEYKLMKAPVNSAIEDWKPIYQVKPHSRMLDMEILKDHCIIFWKYHNALHMDVTSLSSESVTHSMKLPEWACAFQPTLRSEQGSDLFHFYLESPIRPPVMFAYSLGENTMSMEADHADEASAACQMFRLMAQSKDGTLVPITVFWKESDGLRQRPLLVHVYGAYGMDLNMTFKAENRLLVEDGWILAYCHVRGGGELGCNWHKEGILNKKQNSLRDLEACINHLHKLGLSQPCRTAVMATSAGGVLGGALYNSSPGLFQAMILEAPFLDVLNTMMNTSLPLTIEEQEEWGNPVSDVEHYRSIESYCPYQNIRPQNYPSILITAYENDQRVPVKGLLRYVKKLRAAAKQYLQSRALPGSKMPKIILDVHRGGSHCDSLSWEESLQKVAMQLSFLQKELNLVEKENS